MSGLFYTLGVLALTAGLPIFGYLDRAYRELGRVTARRVHAHLETFEAEIEPRFKMERARAALAFSLLARLWLVTVAAVTAVGVFFFVPDVAEAIVEAALLLGTEVVVAMHLLPMLLIAGSAGNWAAPLVPVVRAFLWLSWPIYGFIDLI